MENNLYGGRHWTDRHITKETFTFPNKQEVTLWAGWDETGADIVKMSSSLEDVVTALEKYVESLK